MEPAVHKLLEQSARLFPDKIAFIQADQRVSYRRINERANRVAALFLEQGIAPGDRVVILLRNSEAYLESYYGTLKAGAVAVPINCELRAEALEELLAQLEPFAVILSGDSERLVKGIDTDRFGVRLFLVQGPSLSWAGRRAPVFSFEDVVQGGGAENPRVEIEPSSLCSIIYTSGSTGRPKGVMLSHKNIVANTASIVQYLGLTERDIQMVVLPFFYVMGKSLLNTHVAVGGTVVVNNEFAYTAPVIRQMEKEGVTGFSGVPSTYAYLLHRSPLASYRDRLPALRYCTQAGGHMARELKERLVETLPPHTRLFVMYGATEAAARLTYVEPEMLERKMDSIGRAIPGVAVRVLDETGRELPAGELGELVASGDNIMQGYWKDPDSTARALDKNGYHTGDLGYRDEEGYLYVTGRKDHLLKVGGHRLDPQEVEDALMATGLLLEVVVIGVEDPLLGTKLVALAVPLSDGVGADALLAGCLARLPRHKVPAEVRFLPALPKYPSGKIDRAACLAATAVS